MQTFEQIVSDSYEHGDFELPEISHIGSIHPEDLRYSGITIVHEKIGDTALSESLSSQLEITTAKTLGEGDIRHTQRDDGSGFVTNESTPNIVRAWGTDRIVHERIVTNELTKDD